jgi:haloalkane dehalogenase
MEKVRTPDDQFLNIPDYPFRPNYLQVTPDLRMHYVDEGPKDGKVVLLLHGEPSWSFLYRFMIPVFADAGFRVLSPDLIGFGKSDKPTELNDYTYASHTKWLHSFIKELDLTGINLFCQDWGGLLGLRIAGLDNDRFSTITAGNTGLPIGKGEPSKAFLDWQEYSRTVEVLAIDKIMQNSTVRVLNDAEIKAYTAPFPDKTYMAGAKIFPSLVPTTENDPAVPVNLQVFQTLSQSTKPFLCLFSDKDPITKGGEQIFQKYFKGTEGMPHQIITDAGHFLQEDKGEEIANIMLRFIKENE